ncbi:putative c6 finger domain [Venturia nashicola]|uniref:Putative c6 finger domain n=1 Tax=Venturia nashicola TaxID=86259 RepID=A0A4Z1P2W2_9PEZI|nr:putative c6 finger domain [Venturia nashicola]
MAEENGHGARPSSGHYPDPQTYPSPQMRPTYAWPPAQGQPNEPYRHSPGQSNASLPINLPPLRSIDPQSHSHSPAHPPSHQIEGAVQQQGQPMPGYYPPPPLPNVQHHNHTSAPQLMRYAPIPQGDAHMMAGSRHKKEIKRRTKTGCLTCRKRRIKCDEQHPACRNCQKSKRECLGYDPIFKQQSGPQQLQPAPSASPSSTSSTLAAHSAPPSKYPPAQSSYSPQINSGYAPSPSPHPAHSAHPPPALHQALPQQQQHSYEYTSAIDPALAGAEGAGPPPPPLHPPHDQYSRRTPPPSTSAHSVPPVKMENKPARLIRIEELFSADRHGSPDAQTPMEEISADTMNEIKSIYSNDYAPGLCGILETSWFSTSGWARLSANKATCQQIAQLIELFKRPAGGAGGYEHEVRCRAAETKVVWQLLNLIRPSSVTSNGANGSISSMTLELDEGMKRLDVLEALLTNRILEPNRMTELVYPSDISLEKSHEVDFWRSLGNFVSRRSDDASAAQLLDNALRQCRDNLFSKENRDVIYSGMVARHVGARVPEFPDQILPVGPGGEDNDFNKLYIAKTFLAEQATHKGTNNAIMRICDMISRSWSIR